MRRTKHRIPTKAPEVRPPNVAGVSLRRDVTVQTESRSTDREGEDKDNYGAADSLVPRSSDQRSSLNLFCWSYDRAPGRSETGAYSKLELHENKCFF
jgi:hypothetical protein